LRLEIALASRSNRSRRPPEWGKSLGRNLECDGSRQRFIAGAINLSHATGAYELDNLERTAPGMRRQRHGISESRAGM